MPKNVSEIGIVITGDSRSFARATARTKSDLTSLNRSTSKAKLSFIDLGSTASKAAGLIATAFSVREIAQLADSYTEYTNRLKLVTSTTVELAEAQKEVADIASDTRQSLASTAELYQRLNQANQTLKLSSDELSSVLRTINQTLVISGSSAASSEAAIIQFSQAMSSGVLRGEEFNSVVEQAPRLAQALADGLKVGIGALREMAQQGELTAETVINAISGQADVIEAEFNRTTATVAQGYTVFVNKTTEAIGKLDQLTGSSSTISKWIADYGRGLEKIASTVARIVDPTPLQEYSELVRRRIEIQERLNDINEEEFDYGKFITGQYNEAKELREEMLELTKRGKVLQDELKQIQIEQAAEEKKAADAQAATAKAREENEAAIKQKLADQLEEKKKQIALDKEQAALLREAKKIYQDTLTPLDKYTQKLERINELQAAGKFDSFGGDATADTARFQVNQEKDEYLSGIADELVSEANIPDIDSGGTLAVEERNRIVQELLRENAEEELRIEQEKNLKILTEQNRFTEQQRKTIIQLGKFESLSAKERGRAALDALTETTGAFAGESRKAFELNKQLRTAQAIIDGIGAVQAAYAWGNAAGGPLGGAAAATAAGLFTAGQVQAIQNQQFSGGSSTSVSVAPPAPYTNSQPETLEVTPQGGSSNISDPVVNQQALNFNFVDNSTGVSVETQERTNADGTKEIDLIITDRFNELANNGEFDETLALNYGLQRSGRGR